METGLAEMRDTVEMKDRELMSRGRELEMLRLEMDKREQRLIKAERMTALMEKSRAEVKAFSKKEERDLHYNMASVYAKEGRHREAEQEYLKALRADPTDAGSHYNLGILYDEVFSEKSKAAMHYRAYLKLAPNAPDSDEVKSWLLQLDLR
jgi:tetratricopeptide (TPR) repeat protein